MKRFQFSPTIEAMEDRLVMSTVKILPSLTPAVVAKPSSPGGKAAPASFTARAPSSTQIVLHWALVKGAAQYRIQELEPVQIKPRFTVGSKSKPSLKWVQIGKLDKNASGYCVQNLQPDTIYAFRVGYVKGGLHWMPARTAVTLPPAPTAPTWHATAVSISQINLSWDTGTQCN